MKRWVGSAFGAVLLAGLLYIVMTPVEPSVEVTDAEAWPAPDGVAVYLTIENAGVPDRLIGARSPAAAFVRLDNPDLNGIGAPVPVGTARMTPEAAHLVLSGLTRPPGEMQTIPLVLTFATAGEVEVDVQPMPGAPAKLAGAGSTAAGAVPDAHAGTRVVEEPAPALDIALEEAGQGWHVRVDATNIELDAERAGEAHRTGQGHGHLYVGGMRIARLSGDGRIGAMPPGTHVVRVTLSGNDHRILTHQGWPITASATLDAK